VSPALARCELTHLPRVPVDAALARLQHERYETALASLGCTVLRVADAPDLPDAVFVEDTAVVLPEVAVVTRPGAASRRPETAATARALAAWRPLAFIEEPGTLDGGDVLPLGATLYVGASGRSNASGIGQLRSLLAPFGYAVEAVPFGGCLHLKSAVTAVAADRILVNPAWVDPARFEGVAALETDPAEPHAANVLLVGDAVVYPESFPGTRSRLLAAGVAVTAVDVSELQKAEGAVTCCSLVFEAPAGAR
jgi:dimethylargininase